MLVYAFYGVAILGDLVSGTSIDRSVHAIDSGTFDGRLRRNGG